MARAPGPGPRPRVSSALSRSVPRPPAPKGPQRPPRRRPTRLSLLCPAGLGVQRAILSVYTDTPGGLLALGRAGGGGRGPQLGAPGLTEGKTLLSAPQGRGSQDPCPHSSETMQHRQGSGPALHALCGVDPKPLVTCWTHVCIFISIHTYVYIYIKDYLTVKYIPIRTSHRTKLSLPHELGSTRDPDATRATLSPGAPGPQSQARHINTLI